MPVAAYALTGEQSSAIRLKGLVISVDGKQEVRVTGQGTDALGLGHELAQQALRQGADEILLALTPTPPPYPLAPDI